MGKFVFALMTGLVGAALLHIVIILALPHFTGKDAYTRVLSEGEANRFHMLGDRPDAAGLFNADPFIETAVCHFDIRQQPLRLFARSGPPFWSLAVFDADSNEVFSMTDRTSVDGGGLDLLIATPLQVARLRKTPVPALAQAIVVQMGGDQGYAVLRAMAPQRSFAAAVRGFLDGAACASFILP